MLIVTWSTSPLSYIEKFTLSCLLWLACTNWAGILESKKWVFKAESLKNILTGAMLFYLADLYASDIPNLKFIIVAAYLIQFSWFLALSKLAKQKSAYSFLRG